MDYALPRVVAMEVIMHRRHPLWIFAGVLVLLMSGVAFADVQLQFIDTGTPSGPDGPMNGFHGVIVRVVSTSGFITGIYLDSGKGFEGPMVQRWLAPKNDGVYSQHSPGFLPDNNSGSSVWNYDSHILTPDAEYAGSAWEGGNVTMPSAEVPLASSLSAGYGIGAPGGTLNANFAIAGPSSVQDIAYIVARDAVQVEASVRTYYGGTLEVTGVLLPEPSLVGLAGIGLLTCMRRRG